jgi:hypothetical protein
MALYNRRFAEDLARKVVPNFGETSHRRHHYVMALAKEDANPGEKVDSSICGTKRFGGVAQLV